MQTPAPLILLADDQPDVLTALQLLLKGSDFRTRSAATPEALLSLAAAEPADLIIMDLNYSRDTTSGAEGMALLESLAPQSGGPPVVVMTAWGSVDLAVEAMRRGARDFVLKPWDNAALLKTVRRALDDGRSGAQLSLELERAREVQRRLLPRQVPALSTLDLDAHCRPAGVVGGDWYDFLPLGDGRAGLVLADISGKGLSAALLMAHLHAALRSLAQDARGDVTTLISKLNALFREATGPERFATLFYAEYDDARRTLKWTNCGHPPALLVRAGGAVERLESTATVLGLFPDFRPPACELSMSPGDYLVVYSDGASEAPSPTGEDLGESGLLAILRAGSKDSAETLADRIAAQSPGSLPDDLTLLIARAR